MEDLHPIQIEVLKKLAEYDNLGRVICEKSDGAWSYDVLGKTFVTEKKLCSKIELFEFVKDLHLRFLVDAIFSNREIKKPNGPDDGTVSITGLGIEYLEFLGGKRS